LLEAGLIAHQSYLWTTTIGLFAERTKERVFEEQEERSVFEVRERGNSG
jgi:hypothetical protein